MHKKKKKSRIQRKKNAIEQLKKYKTQVVLEDGTIVTKQKENNLEKKFRNLLEVFKKFKQNNLLYEQEHEIKVPKLKKIKKFDFFIYEHNEDQTAFNYFFCVEIHGDYWHAFQYNEGLCGLKDLTVHQRKNIKNDAFKKNLCKSLNIPLLIFWEHDVYKKPKWILKELQQEIERQKNQPL